MATKDRTLTEWYVETMEEFWSGQWQDSDSAFLFVGLSVFFMFFIPLNLTDITFWIGFAKDLYTQPTYGGSLVAIIIYRKVRQWKLSKKR